MTTHPILKIHAPSLDIVFRVRLLTAENPEVVAQVLRQLPLDSVLGHVVVSGEAIWVPTKIVHLGQTHMVERHVGAVYLYAPGQTICMTYGGITESARVNKFGEVFADDLPLLQRLGAHVWDQTVAQPRKQIVKINIRSSVQ